MCVGMGKQTAPQEWGRSCLHLAGTRQSSESGLLTALIAVAHLDVPWCSGAQTSAHLMLHSLRGSLQPGFSTACSLGFYWDF